MVNNAKTIGPIQLKLDIQVVSKSGRRTKAQTRCVELQVNKLKRKQGRYIKQDTFYAITVGNKVRHKLNDAFMWGKRFGSCTKN